MELLKRVEADLAEYGTVEQHPKMEGRQLMKVITPHKKKKSPRQRRGPFVYALLNQPLIREAILTDGLLY